MPAIVCKRVAPLALRVVQALQRNGGRLGLHDDSPPETIRQAFRTSKKAFKQALGTLYKARRIRFSKPGIELLDNAAWSPGSQPLVNQKFISKMGRPECGRADAAPPRRRRPHH